MPATAVRDLHEGGQSGRVRGRFQPIGCRTPGALRSCRLTGEVVFLTSASVFSPQASRSSATAASIPTKRDVAVFARERELSRRRVRPLVIQTHVIRLDQGAKKPIDAATARSMSACSNRAAAMVAGGRTQTPRRVICARSSATFERPIADVMNCKRPLDVAV